MWTVGWTRVTALQVCVHRPCLMGVRIKFSSNATSITKAQPVRGIWDGCRSSICVFIVDLQINQGAVVPLSRSSSISGTTSA